MRRSHASSPSRRCAALVAALALAAPARAQEPSPPEAAVEAPVAPPSVVGVRLALPAPRVPDESLSEPLLAALRRGVERGGIALLPAEDVARVGGEGCIDDSCVRALSTSLGATHVLRTLVSRESRDYALKLELISATEGTVVAEVAARCELCGLSELFELASDEAARLAPRARESVAPPELQLTSQPPGARVLIDGLPAGVTPLTKALVPGDHVVSLSFDGHLPEERAVRAAAGVRGKLHVVLKRSPTALRLRSVGWGLLFTGIAGVLGGGVLLSIDGLAYQPACHGVDVDYRGECHYLYNTDLGGAALAAGGIALVAVGALLVAQTRDRSRQRRRAALGPRGVVLRF